MAPPRRYTALAALLAAFALALAGCTATQGTKAGGGSVPITLRLGTDDGPGRRSSHQIEDFARRVDELSNGGITIERAWHAAGDVADDWDQAVARLVVDGELDLALIPARAWDTEGVGSMRALNAPFLITSGALTADVVRSDLAATMLAGLEPIGVHGLALLPESLRYVLAFDHPLVSPSDFAGARVRVPASATTYALFEAWGATPEDVVDDAAILGGQVDAVETAFALVNAFNRLPAYAAGNLALWPKVNSLVINTATFKALPADARAVLAEAAAGTRDWSISTFPDSAAEIAAYCAAGGTVVIAPDDDVAALQAAAAPVTDELEKDATTRSLIEAITAMAETSAGPDPVAACAPTPTAHLQSSDDPQQGEYAAFPNGSYRATITAASLRAAGVPEDDVHDHAGIWTLTFDDGVLTTDDINAATGEVKHDDGVYCATATRISVGIQQFVPAGGTLECGNFWTADWWSTKDGIAFSDFRTGIDPDPLGSTIFASVPFVRVS